MGRRGKISIIFLSLFLFYSSSKVLAVNVGSCNGTITNFSNESDLLFGIQDLVFKAETKLKKLFNISSNCFFLGPLNGLLSLQCLFDSNSQCVKWMPLYCDVFIQVVQGGNVDVLMEEIEKTGQHVTKHRDIARCTVENDTEHQSVENEQTEYSTGEESALGQNDIPSVSEDFNNTSTEEYRLMEYGFRLTNYYYTQLSAVDNLDEVIQNALEFVSDKIDIERAEIGVKILAVGAVFIYVLPVEVTVGGIALVVTLGFNTTYANAEETSEIAVFKTDRTDIDVSSIFDIDLDYSWRHAIPSKW